jgi:rhamnosyltransferase
MANIVQTSSSVIAVVVTYYPDIPELNKQLVSLSNQCNAVIIVSNTPNQEQSLLESIDQRIDTSEIQLGKNFGIAYAQNIGILAARDAGADFVLIMDQDSIPENNMVQKLLAVFQEKGNSNVIAAGPSYIDPRTDIRSYFIVSRFGLPHRYKPDKKVNPLSVVQAAFLISSGTLVSIPKLLKVGGMRSNYFIDHVDTEWCLRARAKGYTLIGVHSASMDHSLGDKVKRIWFFYLRSVAHHSPLRDYYMYRNTILMLKDVKMQFLWQCFVVFRLIPFAIYFILFTPNRLIRLRAMLLGLRHGFARIDGEVNLATGMCTPIPKTSLDPA